MKDNTILIEELYDKLDAEDNNDKRKAIMKKILKLDEDNYLIKFRLIYESKYIIKTKIKKYEQFLIECKDYLVSHNLYSEEPNSLYYIYDRAGRAYLFALISLGELYSYFDIEKTKDYFELVIKLNPNDNMNIRWQLMCIYYNEHDYDNVSLLINKYKNDLGSDVMKLLISRRKNAKLYNKIMKKNPYILLLLSEVIPPFTKKEYEAYESGSYEEADNYYYLFRNYLMSSNEVYDTVYTISTYIEKYGFTDIFDSLMAFALINIVALIDKFKTYDIELDKFKRLLLGDDTLEKKYKDLELFKMAKVLNNFNKDKLDETINNMFDTKLIYKLDDKYFRITRGGLALSIIFLEDKEDIDKDDDLIN